MARTDSTWAKTAGAYLKSKLGLLVGGVNSYINFGSVYGSSGYGIRDNGGTIEIKNSGGAWTEPGGGGGGGISTEQAVDAVATAIAAGTHSGITITYDDAGNAIDFDISDEIYETADKNKVDNLPANTTTELAAKVAVSSIVNTLTSTATNVPLSAAQGKALKDLIDTINALLVSDESTLDTLQEIVDFIEINKSTLDSLAISSIAGLQTALDGKSATGHTHTKSEVTDLNAYEVGGTDVAVADGGTGASNASGARTNLGVDAAGTDNAPAASTSVAGKVERATDTEFTTGSDTTRHTTPAQVASVAQTMTNKRVQPRVNSQASTATLTPEIDTYDVFDLTAQAAALTIANHSSSTPADGEMMRIRVLDNATARAISFGSNYAAKAGSALPTTTTASKQLTMGFEWYAGQSKWVLTALAEEA